MRRVEKSPNHSFQSNEEITRNFTIFKSYKDMQICSEVISLWHHQNSLSRKNNHQIKLLLIYFELLFLYFCDRYFSQGLFFFLFFLFTHLTLRFCIICRRVSYISPPLSGALFILCFFVVEKYFLSFVSVDWKFAFAFFIFSPFYHINIWRALISRDQSNPKSGTQKLIVMKYCSSHKNIVDFFIFRTGFYINIYFPLNNSESFLMEWNWKWKWNGMASL